MAAMEASLNKINLHSTPATSSPLYSTTYSLEESKQVSRNKVGTNLGPNIQSPTEDFATEKKYLELVDLLTVRMFEGSSNIEKPPEQNNHNAKDNSSSRKSNSLPRTLDVSASMSRGLHKSSSNQSFSHELQSGTGLSAYERLFGRPKPGSGLIMNLTLRLFTFHHRQPAPEPPGLRHPEPWPGPGGQRQEEGPDVHPQGAGQVTQRLRKSHEVISVIWVRV